MALSRAISSATRSRGAASWKGCSCGSVSSSSSRSRARHFAAQRMQQQPGPASTSAAASDAAATTAAAASGSKKLVLVVAAALIDAQERRVLLAQRPPGKAMAGLWEFPGGKVDAGETPEAALARELREELSIEVDPADLEPLTFASHSYDSFHLLMPLYACRRWRGDPAPAEGQALAWAAAGELSSYEMPAADVPLVAPLVAALEGCKQ